jgi:ABC-type amino acid transport substrate-binding protein
MSLFLKESRSNFSGYTFAQLTIRQQRAQQPHNLRDTKPAYRHKAPILNHIIFPKASDPTTSTRPAPMTNCSKLVHYFCCNQVILLPIVLLLLVFSQETNSQQTPDTPDIDVTYPSSEAIEGTDERTVFFIQLLKTALAQSDKKYMVRGSMPGLTSARQVQMTLTGDIDVVWITNNTEGSQHLMPIEIPLDKGLIGWRIFLINKGDQPVFSAIKTLEDLQKIPLGQVQYWHDTEILRANNFSVVPTPTYPSTFKMLKRKRFLYFPRSISEIWNEQENQKHHDIVVEKDLLIQYPVAYFFYVSKSNMALADDIKNGLEKIIKTGVYEQLFQEYNGKYIALTDLPNRRIFRLENPFLKDSMVMKYKDYWFQPER